MQNHLVIRGPHGRFHVNRETGEIVSPLPLAYRYYIWADTLEYMRWAGENGIDLDAEVPILAIGLRTKYGRYHEAVEVWREEHLIACREEENARYALVA